MNSFDVYSWLAALPLRGKILAFATVVVLVELAFRRFAPRSPAYARWTAFFQGIGKVWTAVLLAVVYVVSVGAVGLTMRLIGRDPLDRSLNSEPTFWRRHEPNPLGPEAGVRHQF